jgi:hypothetical protein
MNGLVVAKLHRRTLLLTLSAAVHPRLCACTKCLATGKLRVRSLNFRRDSKAGERQKV